MKIVIYEDNFNDRKNTIQCINIFFNNKNIEYTISICNNTDDLLNSISTYDICFLDIELGNENGIEIGMRIRELNRDIRIIIVSNYSKYLIDGYKLHADRYFIKPIDQTEFNIELESILVNYLDKYLGIEDSKISKDKIYFNDILYVEFFDRRANLYLLNGKKISTTYSLTEWNKILHATKFAQPHKSYLVNLKHISGFKTGSVVLINSEEIPLSRYYKKDFETKYVHSLHRGW